MPAKPAVLKLFRQIHLYFGLLISPALLFFAFTGAVQTLSLHEAAGNSYKPPAWLAELGQVHKKQTALMPVRRPPAPEAPRADAPHQDSAHGDRFRGPMATGSTPAGSAAPPAGPQQPVTLAGKQKQHLLLKIFFLLVSLGLFTSTLTGIYMAYKYDRNKILVTALLLAGIVLPLVLLPF